MIISFDSLPPNSKEFIKKYFKAPVGIVQQDKNSYEVYLSDGTELEFSSDGSWREIEAKITPLDLDILPVNIASIVKNEFKNIKAKEIEKKINYYKIKLVNNIKVLIDFNGTILHKEYDD
ncbi:PepSY-like domain-containing protein [Campylobacter sp. TTU-622]|uniref:PepSY-like domain-containing protein n=1 Tax=unclassified Campylobacter TaxID=2593542 RepID=UPI0019089F45|nr:MULTISPECIES: PepSY-like domain-containing protein [unclassified Campylobacter]MBK1971012.1 PepSY-like domain-containing protein [Campylobacter sp. TTU_617]MBK1973134.1 PepSY-like domain-containing protein [Campylobacter sp. TTU-622]MBK1991369.1 PepSY-like domain-containing protein [Campylobacter sp. 2018MI34]